MNPVREQFGVILLFLVLLTLLGFLYVFRQDHDVVLSINQWIAGVIGGILSLVTGKVAHASQQSNITDSKVTQVVTEEKPIT